MEGEVLNISPVVVWVVALSQLLTFGLTIWNLMASGSRANAKLLQEQAKTLDTHNLRITGLENSQVEVPRVKDLHVLELTLEQIKGEMKAMNAAMRGTSSIMERLEQIVGRHEQHLLDGGKR
jgi:hypothetical protein